MCFNIFFGNSVSIHSLIELADKNKDLDDIINALISEDQKRKMEQPEE